MFFSILVLFTGKENIVIFCQNKALQARHSYILFCNSERSKKVWKLCMNYEKMGPWHWQVKGLPVKFSNLTDPFI